MENFKDNIKLSILSCLVLNDTKPISVHKIAELSNICLKSVYNHIKDMPYTEIKDAYLYVKSDIEFCEALREESIKLSNEIAKLNNVVELYKDFIKCNEE